jgi:hypothetical protein
MDDVTIIVQPNVASIIVQPSEVTISVNPVGSPGISGVGLFVDATDDVTMAKNTVYRANDPDDRVLFSLPVTANFGDAPITILGYNLGGWKIIQRDGEQITISGDVNATTTGTAGYIQSVNVNDSITLYPMGAGIYDAMLNGCTFN